MSSLSTSRMFLLALVLAAGAASMVAAGRSPSAMTDAATRLLGSLTAEQRQQAAFAFAADERMHWHFIPTEMFPRKAAKKSGAPRKGAAFVALRADGFILVRTRAEKGLLGGMTEVPSAWSRDFDPSTALTHAPFPDAAWRRLPGQVTHVFTHFPLELVVYFAELPKSGRSKPTRVPDGARYAPAIALLADLHGRELPPSLSAGEEPYEPPVYDIEAMLVEVELVNDWYAPAIARLTPPSGARRSRGSR